MAAPELKPKESFAEFSALSRLATDIVTPLQVLEKLQTITVGAERFLDVTQPGVRLDWPQSLQCF